MRWLASSDLPSLIFCQNLSMGGLKNRDWTFLGVRFAEFREFALQSLALHKVHVDPIIGSTRLQSNHSSCLQATLFLSYTLVESRKHFQSLQLEISIGALVRIYRLPLRHTGEVVRRNISERYSRSPPSENRPMITMNNQPKVAQVLQRYTSILGSLNSEMTG